MLVEHPSWWREVHQRSGGYTVTGGAPGRRSTLGVDLPLSVALRRLCASLWSTHELWTASPVGAWRSWRCVEPDLGEVVLGREDGRWTFTAAGSTSSVDPALEDFPFPTLLRAWADDSAGSPPRPRPSRAGPVTRTLQCALPLARFGRWELLETWLDLPRRTFRVGDRWGRAETDFGVLRGWVRASAPWLGDPFTFLPDRRFTNDAVRSAEAGIAGPLARVALPDGRTLEISGAVPVGSDGLHTAVVRVDGRVRRALGEGPCGAVVEALRAVDPSGPPLWTGPST